MASKKSSKGKRYTDAEKQQIVEFVNGVNAEKGRGGVTAAAKKFAVSNLTISAWVKKGVTAGVPTAGKGTASKSAGGRTKVLDQLAALDREIAGKRKDLMALEAKFQKLKDLL